jgi:hypothetical protein
LGGFPSNPNMARPGLGGFPSNPNMARPGLGGGKQYNPNNSRSSQDRLKSWDSGMNKGHRSHKKYYSDSDFSDEADSGYGSIPSRGSYAPGMARRFSGSSYGSGKGYHSFGRPGNFSSKGRRNTFDMEDLANAMDSVRIADGYSRHSTTGRRMSASGYGRPVFDYPDSPLSPQSRLRSHNPSDRRFFDDEANFPKQPYRSQGRSRGHSDY